MQYLFRKPFGVHSPFLYSFADQCIFADHMDPRFGQIEKKRSLSPHHHVDAPKPKYCRLLYRTVSYFDVRNIIELATGEEITREYFLLANPSLKIETAQKASLTSLTDSVFEGIIYIGEAKDTNKLLESYRGWNHQMGARSVVIISGIRSSRSKKRLWNALVSDPNVTLSLDLGSLGYLFFNQALSKQNIRLGF